MRHWPKGLLVFLLLAGVGACNKVTKPDDSTPNCKQSKDDHGVVLDCDLASYSNRSYTIFLPEGFESSQPPLIFAIHGGGGNSGHAIRTTCPDGEIDNPLCLHNMARDRGYAVVAPNGTSSRLIKRIRTWNAGGGENGYRCASGRACKDGVDDIAYFNALLDDVSLLVNYDSNRVYATGLSNGGAMSHRLACELSQRITAIFAVGGANQYATAAQCLPETPVAITHVHGTADPCWKYNGGAPDCSFVGQKGLIHVEVSRTMAEWTAINRCNDIVSVEHWPDLDGNGDETVVYDHRGCVASVVLLQMDGTGHTWPNGDQYFRESLVGPVSRDWGNEKILEFFDAHSR